MVVTLPADALPTAATPAVMPTKGSAVTTAEPNVAAPVAAALTLEHQGKGRVAGDVEAGDVVHLEGDVERHGMSLE